MNIYGEIKCNECGIVFKTEGELMAHNESVHGESICKVCNMPFGSKEELAAHNAKVHKM